MDRIAVVILNYLNDNDTVACVDSLMLMHYPICGVVVVDNASPNSSFERLKKRYKNNNQIHIITSKKNQGYARGNNIGINFARRRLKADFVLVVNNDIEFVDKKYIRGMMHAYYPGVGVIGSRIILEDESEASSFVYFFELRDLIADYLNMLSAFFGSSFDFPKNNGRSQVILNGCALMLTPDFFQYYHGFFKHTFLYHEEAILYLMCRCKNLKQVYVPDVRIHHKSKQSSLASFQNARNVINKYELQSKKYVILFKLKYEFKLTRQRINKMFKRNLCKKRVI